ncbi:MAG: hypothetical protein ACI4Q9_03290 [Candidatus Methanomethylophilaceae archaeon]
MSWLTLDGLVSDGRTLHGRQRELDAVRGLSVFLMVGAHVFNQFTPLSTEPVSDGGFFTIVSRLVGAFPGGAQCFMMVMGMVLLFSTTVTGKKLVKRGFVLIAAGFILEFLRALPGMVNLAITGTFVSFYPEYSYATNEQLIILTLFWQDILIFAGMALIFLGIVRLFDIPDIWVIAVTVVMMVANEFVAGMDTGNDAVNILLGYFWGTTVFDGNMTTSRFPMFSWIVYPVAGYLIGKRLICATDKDRFYRTVGKLFLLISVPFTVIGLFTGMFDTGFTGIGFYHQGILINIWCTLLSFDWIVVMYLVSLKVPSRYLAHLERWSRNITSIYILHFVVLAVAIQVMPRSFGIIGCIVVFLVLFFAVDAATSYLERRKKRTGPSAV